MSFVKCRWLEPLYKSEERGIIPITWIQDHGGHRVVRWPPGMVDVQQHIRRQTVPTEDWKVFVLIKILSIPGTESDCDITTTDTDDDNSTDRQPRRRKARLDDYMTIKEYDELVASLKKQGTKRKAAEPAPTCSGSVPPAPVPSPFRKSRPPKVLVPDIETLLEQVEKIDESEPEQHDAMQQIVTHTDCSNKVILQSLQNLHMKVDQLEEKLKRKLNSANFTLTKIEKDTCNGEKKVFSNEQPLLLKQCNTVEDIIELEQLLQDQQFEKRVMEILQTVGGNNMKKGIYRMLSRIMTIQCASLFNITGKEKSQKSNFKNLKINYAILESAKAVYNKTYTDKDAESSVGAWLRQSGNTYTRNITRASQ